MQTNPETPASNEFPPSVHAYCRSSALCVAHSSDRLSRPTIILEFAKKGAGRGYDWSKKLSFQMTQVELAELGAYLRRPWAAQRWVHTSPASVVKGLQLCKQDQSILFELSTATGQFRVPVIPRDQYFIRNLVLARLFEIQPDLPLQAHYDSLDQLAVTLASKNF